MLDLFEKCKLEGTEIKYVWFDTGLEYQATKDHIKYLEEEYGIKIDRYKAVKPIPLTVKEYGVPFISKHVSEMISRLQKHNFQWEDESFDVLIERYPNCRSALKWWCNCSSVMTNISRNKYLKEFLIQNKLDFKVSNSCCYYAKKKCAKEYKKRKQRTVKLCRNPKSRGRSKICSL